MAGEKHNYVSINRAFSAAWKLHFIPLSHSFSHPPGNCLFSHFKYLPAYSFLADDLDCCSLEKKKNPERFTGFTAASMSCAVQRNHPRWPMRLYSASALGLHSVMVKGIIAAISSSHITTSFLPCSSYIWAVLSPTFKVSNPLSCWRLPYFSAFIFSVCQKSNCVFSDSSFPIFWNSLPTGFHPHHAHYSTGTVS